MSLLHLGLLALFLTCCILVAGCTQFPSLENHGIGMGNTSLPASAAKYQRTIAQPEESSGLIRMDTDVYNAGEVVEFTITNTRKDDLSCSVAPPSFNVQYQKGTARWVIRMGEERETGGTAVKLKPGESTAPYRFLTDGWAPGRYRIVTDCGISHEFILRAIPAMTTPAPQCLPAANATPFIRINPISDQYAGEPFRISGTTSLPVGETIRYSLFALVSETTNITSTKLTSSSITVSARDCRINTWSVEGVIQVPGDYFIGVSDSRNSVSAVKRFSVLAKTGVTETAPLPAETQVPGITTD